MATQQPLSQRLRTAITLLIKADEADSFKGMGDPEDHQQIEETLRRANKRIATLLLELKELEKK